jgi:hypothetical protein
MTWVVKYKGKRFGMSEATFQEFIDVVKYNGVEYEVEHIEDGRSQQAPIARLTIEGGVVTRTGVYAPGLPDGEHELYCEPAAVAPYLRAVQPGEKL